MKIIDLETFVDGNPPPHFGGQYFIFVKLTTDDGIFGYGEIYGATFAPDVLAAGAIDVGERHLVGQTRSISSSSGAVSMDVASPSDQMSHCRGS